MLFLVIFSAETPQKFAILGRNARGIAINSLKIWLFNPIKPILFSPLILLLSIF